MDPRAVKEEHLTVEDTYFIMQATKQDGEKRVRYYRKLNYAIRALWRIRYIATGKISVRPAGKTRTYQLIGRFSKNGKVSKRALNWQHIESLEDRPIVKGLGRVWHQMPRAGINEIE